MLESAIAGKRYHQTHYSHFKEEHTMPDLNLQDDEGTQENPEGSGENDGEMTETAPSEEEAQEENGGGMMKILIIVAGILILGGGTVFLLNSLGVIKLW